MGLVRFLNIAVILSMLSASAAAQPADPAGPPDEDVPAQQPQGPKGKKQRGEQDAQLDSVFTAAGAAAGSVAGLAAVGLTAAAAGYVTLSVANILGPRLARENWGFSLIGVALVVVSTAAIPAGAAFGTWWGAGLRGLPLPLVEAAGHMAIGLILGAALGLAGFSTLGVVGAGAATGLVWLGALADPTQNRVPPLGIPSLGYAGAFFGFGALPVAVLGTLAGAAVGPILTAGRWGFYAAPPYHE